MSYKKYLVALDIDAENENGILQSTIYDFFSKEDAIKFYDNLAEVADFKNSGIMEQDLDEEDYKIHLFAHWCLLFLGLPDIHLGINEVKDLDGSCMAHPDGTQNGYVLHMNDMRFNLANIFSIAHQMRFIWLCESYFSRGIDIVNGEYWDESFNVDMYAFATFVIEFFFEAANMESCFVDDEIMCNKIKEYEEHCSDVWASKIGYALTFNNYVEELEFESLRESVVEAIKNNDRVDPKKIFAKKPNKERLN